MKQDIPLPVEHEDPELGALLRWFCGARPLRPLLLHATRGVFNPYAGSYVALCAHLWPDTARNAPCPCGSGVKFKKCR